MRSRSFRAIVPTILVAFLLIQGTTDRLHADAKPTAPPLTLKVGDTAPDFTLKYFTGEKLSDVALKDYRGKKSVLLAFYVFAFTGG